MQTLHEKTNITLKKYYSEPQFIDYTTQPSSQKSYPHFYRRFNLDEHEALSFIKNFGQATFTKQYGKDEVTLRTIPSAGGLYPCEIYIQIRKVKGMLSGIYHYEPLKNSLTLIHELSNDGLEVYFEEFKTAQQFIFLISCVPFRTTWKYEDRSIRYLLLDCGHQIGAINTACNLADLHPTLSTNFDKEKLNSLFGFDNKEYFMAALSIDLEQEANIKPLREALPFVPACDYYLPHPFIDDFFAHYNKEENYTLALPSLSSHINQEAIHTRRSCRAFKNESLCLSDFKTICTEVFEFSASLGIEIFYINNNIEEIPLGLYKNVSCLKEGDFRQKAQELALNQALGGKSAATLFFTVSKQLAYAKSTILSAYLAHMIYLKCSALNLECSAVGAYFDEECQTFLESSNNILYLICIGK